MLNGYRMIPFVMETYGGLAPEARDLLALLAKHATDMGEHEWFTHAVRCMSAALQSGNAFVSQAGMQQQFTSETRRRRFVSSQNRYEESRRPVRVRPPRPPSDAVRRLNSAVPHVPTDTVPPSPQRSRPLLLPPPSPQPSPPSQAASRSSRLPPLRSRTFASVLLSSSSSVHRHQSVADFLSTAAVPVIQM